MSGGNCVFAILLFFDYDYFVDWMEFNYARAARVFGARMRPHIFEWRVTTVLKLWPLQLPPTRKEKPHVSRDSAEWTKNRQNSQTSGARRAQICMLISGSFILHLIPANFLCLFLITMLRYVSALRRNTISVHAIFFLFFCIRQE